MEVLFVHGMGRTRRSARPMLRTLAKSGLTTSTFGYSVILETFDAIRLRLETRLHELSELGDYVLVGHSLGGVLLRAALQASTPPRAPSHLFLLGSPFRSSRFARRLARNPLFMVLTRDCGQLLGSDIRMEQIGPTPGPATCIVGTRELGLTRPLFDGASNDGVVAADEVTHESVTDCIYLDVLHTWLPASQQVAKILLQRIGDAGGTRK